MAKSQTAQKAKTSSSLFRIHVRPDAIPTQAKIGRVRENEFVGDTYPVEVNTPIQYIPNFYEALVIKQLEPNGMYRGKFKFLNEVDEKERENSEVVKIEIRYIASTPSLDKKWQEENGFKPSNEIEEVGWPLQSGKIHDFNLSSLNDHFIRFMNNHQGCGSNPQRDTENSVLFNVIDGGAKLSEQVDALYVEEQILEFKKKIKNATDDFINSVAPIFKINTSYDVPTKRADIIAKISKDPTHWMEVYKQKAETLMATWEKLIENESAFLSDGMFYSIITKEELMPEHEWHTFISNDNKGNGTVIEFAEYVYDDNKLFKNIEKLNKKSK